MTQSFIMLGGSLTRYHTPTLKGKGFSQELVKLAGPTLLRSIGHGLDAYEKGASAAEAVKSSSQVLKRGLKRKIPAAIRDGVLCMDSIICMSLLLEKILDATSGDLNVNKSPYSTPTSHRY